MEWVINKLGKILKGKNILIINTYSLTPFIAFKLWTLNHIIYKSFNLEAIFSRFSLIFLD